MARRPAGGRALTPTEGYARETAEMLAGLGRAALGEDVLGWTTWGLMVRVLDAEKGVALFEFPTGVRLPVNYGRDRPREGNRYPVTELETGYRFVKAFTGQWCRTFATEADFTAPGSSAPDYRWGIGRQGADYTGWHPRTLREETSINAATPDILTLGGGGMNPDDYGGFRMPDNTWLNLMDASAIGRTEPSLGVPVPDIYCFELNSVSQTSGSVDAFIYADPLNMFDPHHPVINEVVVFGIGGGGLSGFYFTRLGPTTLTGTNWTWEWQEPLSDMPIGRIFMQNVPNYHHVNGPIDANGKGLTITPYDPTIYPTRSGVLVARFLNGGPPIISVDACGLPGGYDATVPGGCQGSNGWSIDGQPPVGGGGGVTPYGSGTGGPIENCGGLPPGSGGGGGGGYATAGGTGENGGTRPGPFGGFTDSNLGSPGGGTYGSPDLSGAIAPGSGGGSGGSNHGPGAGGPYSGRAGGGIAIIFAEGMSAVSANGGVGGVGGGAGSGGSLYLVGCGAGVRGFAAGGAQGGAYTDAFHKDGGGGRGGDGRIHIVCDTAPSGSSPAPYVELRPALLAIWDADPTTGENAEALDEDGTDLGDVLGAGAWLLPTSLVVDFQADEQYDPVTLDSINRPEFQLLGSPTGDFAGEEVRYPDNTDPTIWWKAPMDQLANNPFNVPFGAIYPPPTWDLTPLDIEAAPFWRVRMRIDRGNDSCASTSTNFVRLCGSSG